MAAYQSAEQGRTLTFPPRGLDRFVPAVGRGNGGRGDSPARAGNDLPRRATGPVAQETRGRSSSNVSVVAHIPLAGPLQVEDIEIEQELSRPYAYVTRSQRWGGFHIIDLRDPRKARVLYSWSVPSPELHKGSGGTGPAYLKSKGRYYFVQAFQFQPGGPDADLGAVVFDVTGLPDTSSVRVVREIREPALPGGFHEVFAYKHSSRAALIFVTNPVGQRARLRHRQARHRRP